MCCIFSYADDKHGKRIADVVQRVLSDHGVEIPVPLSSRGARTILFEQCHHRGLRRRQKSRATRRRGGDRAQGQGFRYGVQTVLSYGGLAGVRYPRLHETMISGPVGASTSVT